MADEKPATAEKKAIEAPKTPKRVKMVNKNKMNGVIGAIASPLAKDEKAWTAAGWVRAD